MGKTLIRPQRAPMQVLAGALDPAEVRGGFQVR